MNKKWKIFIMFLLLISSFTGCSHNNVIDYIAEENEPVKKNIIVTDLMLKGNITSTQT